MSAIGNIELEIACYNSKLALWEPVVEASYLPNPRMNANSERVSLSRKLVKKRWDANITLQYNSKNDFGSGVLSPSFEDFVTPQVLPPLMSLSFQSRDPIEVTITKTFLKVLKDFQSSFATEKEAVEDRTSISELPQGSFVLKNRIGKTITVILDNKGAIGSFRYVATRKNSVGDHATSRNQIEVQDGNDISLELSKDRTVSDNEGSRYDEYISPLREQSEQAEVTLKLRVDGERGVFDLPVSKADKRFFPFQFRGDEMGDNHGMVSEIVVHGGCKTLTLRSILQFRNFFSKPVDIYKNYNDGNRMLLKKLATIPPEKYCSQNSGLGNSSTYNVPISSVYSAPYEFQFKIADDGQNMGLESYPWREIKSREKKYAQQIQCTNSKGSPNIFLNVNGTEENIFTEKIDIFLKFQNLEFFPSNCTVCFHFTRGPFF